MLVELCTCGSVSGRFVVGVNVWCRGEEWSSVSRVSCVGRNMESQRRSARKLVVLIHVVVVVVVVCVS